MKVTLGANRKLVKIDDILTYTISLQNDYCSVKQVQVVCPLSKAIDIQKIYINNEEEELEDVDNVLIDNMEPGERLEIILVGKLVYFAKENPIVQMVDVYYIENNQPCTLTSNAEICLVVDANITRNSGSFYIQADKENVDVGEVITYTVYLKNQGNIEAELVCLSNLIPEGTTIVEGYEAYEQGVYIQQLMRGEERYFNYKVYVNTCPMREYIINQVQVEYQFWMPNRQIARSKSKSDTIMTKVQHVCFDDLDGFYKKSSKKVVTIGEKVTYTIGLKNKGTVPAYGVAVIDSVPKGCIIVEGTTKINGSLNKELDIQEGIIFEKIQPGEAIIVDYQIEVQSWEEEQNRWELPACMSYMYYVGDKIVRATLDSQLKPIEVYCAMIHPIAQTYSVVEQVSYTLGDTICIEVSGINKGNLPIELLEIRMMQIEWIQYIRGCWQLSNIGVGEKWGCTLTYKVKKIPTYNPITIGLTITYDYIMPDYIRHSMNVSEAVQVGIFAPIFQTCLGGKRHCFTQKVVGLEEVVQGKLELTNRGNIEATHIVLDIKGKNSFCLLNEHQFPIEINCLMPGDTREIYYDILWKSIPKSGKEEILLAMTYDYTLNDMKLHTIEEVEQIDTMCVQDVCLSIDAEEIIQKVEESYVTVGEIIHYTLPLMNEGNVPAKQILLELPHLSYGVWQQENPMTLETIKPGEAVTFKYALKVEKLPISGQIDMKPSLSYLVQVPEREEVRRYYEVNTVVTVVEMAQIDEETGGIKRSISTKAVSIGENVTYSLIIHNKGNVIAYGVRLEERSNRECLYEEGSFKIDYQPIDKNPLQDSIYLGDIAPGQHYTIQYNILCETMPDHEVISTVSHIKYSYQSGASIKKVHKTSSPLEVAIFDPAIGIIDRSLEVIVDKQVADIGDVIQLETKICVLGNQRIEAMWYKFSTQHIVWEPLESEVEYEVQTLDIGESYVLTTYGKVLNLPETEYVCIQGQLKYTFYDGIGEVERVVYTPEKRINICTAGPLQASAFYLESNEKVVYPYEPFELNCTIINQGNLKMENVILTIDGSLEGIHIQDVEETTINCGCLYQGKTIEIEEIEAYETLNLVVRACLTEIPKTFTMSMYSKLDYSYTIEDEVRQLAKKSNEVTFKMRACGIGLPEAVSFSNDKEVAQIGEVITYHIKMVNKGNTTAKNIKLDLVLSRQVEWEVDKVVAKGARYQGRLDEKVIVPTLELEECFELQFQGIVQEIFPTPRILVGGNILYEYQDGAGKLKIYERELEAVCTKIESVDFRMPYFWRSINQTEVTVGEKVHYEIQCENGGNKEAQNTQIHLCLPEGLTYLEDTLQTNRNTQKYRCEHGILFVGTVMPREKIVFKFQCMGNKINEQEKSIDRTYLQYEEGNQVVQIEAPLAACSCIQPQLTVNLELEPKEILVDEWIHYTLKLMNNGNTTALNVQAINLVPQEIYLQDSIVIGDLYAGQEKVVQFRGRAIKRPNGKYSRHEIKVGYQYRVGEKNYYEECKGNKEELKIEEASLSFFKHCSRQNVEVGEEIFIASKIINTGTVKIPQMIYKDEIAESLVLVEGSFRVDEKRLLGVVLKEGIDIGMLDVGEKCYIEYKLRVQGYDESTIMHRSWVCYSVYNLQGQMKDRISEQVEEILQVKSPYRTYYPYESKIYLQHDMKDLEKILEIDPQIKCINCTTNQARRNELDLRCEMKYRIIYQTAKCIEEIILKKIVTLTIENTQSKTLTIENVEVMIEKLHYIILDKRGLQVQCVIEIVSN